MKALSKQGHGMSKKQADIVTEEQENSTWEKGVLGINYSQHRNLRVGPQSQIKDRLTRTDKHLVTVFKIHCPIS